MTRFKQTLAPLVLLAALGLSGTSPALAQEGFDPNTGAPVEEGAGGDPWIGYGAFGFFAVAIVFAVCKTARR